MTCCAYACVSFFVDVLGSDGTVSVWDKDARTRMKSKPSLHTTFLGHIFSALLLTLPGRLFSHFSPAPNHSVSPLPFIHSTEAYPHVSTPCSRSIHQHSVRCPAQSSVRRSTRRGRYSLTPSPTIGRRGMWGTCLLSGTRLCCTGARKTSLGNGHPRAGWVKSEC